MDASIGVVVGCVLDERRLETPMLCGRVQMVLEEVYEDELNMAVLFLCGFILGVSSSEIVTELVTVVGEYILEILYIRRRE